MTDPLGGLGRSPSVDGPHADELPDAWSAASMSEWAERLGVPRLEIHHRIDSTNSRLRALALDGAPAFTMVVADGQTAGRGRGGKPWYSAPGSGLWMSLLLPLGPKGVPGPLPLAVGVAVACAIEHATGVRASLKWPNDLLIDGAKLAGILCESAGENAVAVGIGVNLRAPEGGLPDDLDHPPAFLEALADNASAPSDNKAAHAPELAKSIVDEVRRWADPVPIGLDAALRAEWEARDCLLGRIVRVESGQTGVCHGVDVEGALLVAPDGESPRAFRSGSVRLAGLRASAPGTPAAARAR